MSLTEAIARQAESYLRDNYDKGQLEKADTLAGMEGNGI